LLYPSSGLADEALENPQIGPASLCAGERFALFFRDLSDNPFDKHLFDFRI
jgi:hypothetical protein